RWSGPQWNDRAAVCVLAGNPRIGLWLPQLAISRGRGGPPVHYAVHVGRGHHAGLVQRTRSHGPTLADVEGGGRARSPHLTDPARTAHASAPDGNGVELWDSDVTTGSAGPVRAVAEGVYGL